MDQIVVQSGAPTFIEEIVSSSADLDGKSVCITGKLCEHMVDKSIAKLSDPQSKQDIVINTALIEPFQAKFGSLFQMIGELETVPGQAYNLRLKARVVRCVDGMDLTLYRQAIECQRMYFSKR